MIGLKVKKEMKDVENSNTTTSSGQLQFKKGFYFFNYLKYFVIFVFKALALNYIIKKKKIFNIHKIRNKIINYYCLL